MCVLHEGATKNGTGEIMAPKTQKPRRGTFFRVIGSESKRFLRLSVDISSELL